MKKVNYPLILDELDLLPNWTSLEKNHNTFDNEMAKLLFHANEVFLEGQGSDKQLSSEISEKKYKNSNSETYHTLEELQQSVSICMGCALSKGRKQTVFGFGDPEARWLFIGEAPGENEDYLGKPFVGVAGKLLDNMLLALGMNRNKEVYITNIIKCRPPKNRDPFLEEVISCKSYLEKQIDFIKPKIIVALGRFAAQNLVGSQKAIGSLRLKEHFYKKIPVIVTYHPAYLLRNPYEKAKTWEDLLYAKSIFATKNDQK